jgi:TAG lipase/lysophosphatidylethanolamine acyltransferase
MKKLIECLFKILRFVFANRVVLLVFRFVQECVTRLSSWLYGTSPSRAALLRQLAECKEYNEWRRVARLLDEDEGFNAWREEEDEQVSMHLLRDRVERLSEIKKQVDRGEVSIDTLIAAMQTDLHRSTLGIANPTLYPFRTGTKETITTYINLMVFLVRTVSTTTTMDPVKRYKALKQMQWVFGRSALLLNGSVALGAYHLGIVKALHQAKLLPNIIFGSNTGALVAACLCCLDNIEGVLSGDAIDFSAFAKRGTTGSLKRKWDRLWKEGTLMDVTVLEQFAKDNLGEITFREAYRKTGRTLNVNVTMYYEENKTTGTWLFNHYTTPDALVYTAAVSSCATPLIYGLTPLRAKARDGSIIAFDPPALSFSTNLASFHINDAVVRLREQCGVKMSVVSECSISRLPYLTLNPQRALPLKVIHFFTEEIWRFLAWVSRLRWFRSRLTGLLQNASDVSLSDVVVYPAATAQDLVMLLQNPDRRILDYCTLRGCQIMWPMMPLMKTHIAIEQAIHEGIRLVLEEGGADRTPQFECGGTNV